MTREDGYRHNIFKRVIQPEQFTSLRFSLAYEPIGSNDLLVNHPSGEKVRIVEYNEPSSEELQTAKELLKAKGLILGNEIGSQEFGENAFIVPESARPLAYDAASDSEGSYAYGDSKLFYDLGFMLGALLKLNKKNYVISADVGHAVALVEFSKPDSRQIFFVPGIENILKPVEHEEEALPQYHAKLEQEFGTRFSGGSLFLTEGFNVALHSEN